MRTFTVTAERTPRKWWVLEAPEVGAVSQVRRLDQAADEMREAIAYLAGIPESEVQVDVQAVLPHGFEAARTRYRRERRKAQQHEVAAAAANREAARVLLEQGFTVRDIGLVMEVSPQRVSQLVKS